MKESGLQSNCFILEPGEYLYIGNESYQPLDQNLVASFEGYWSGICALIENQQLITLTKQ